MTSTEPDQPPLHLEGGRFYKSINDGHYQSFPEFTLKNDIIHFQKDQLNLKLMNDESSICDQAPPERSQVGPSESTMNCQNLNMASGSLDLQSVAEIVKEPSPKKAAEPIKNEGPKTKKFNKFKRMQDVDKKGQLYTPYIIEPSIRSGQKKQPNAQELPRPKSDMT